MVAHGNLDINGKFSTSQIVKNSSVSSLKSSPMLTAETQEILVLALN